MKRMTITPRPHWQSRVEELGLVWHSAAGQPYWDESAYYQFTSAQVDQISKSTEEVYQMFLTAGQSVIDRNLFRYFGIPDRAVPAIIDAWDREPPALNYGRFDFGYDGVTQPKLFEFNCDTPTSLLEAAVIQWDWKEQAMPHRDQFNRIDDALVEQFAAIKPLLPTNVIHFTHVNDDAGEDTLTVSYLRDCARRAGFDTVGLMIDQLGYDHVLQCFVDIVDEPIDTLFKLYPWEWMVNEDYADQAIGASMRGDIFLEPIWKMIWSNKAILAVLWELFPGHPNLLPAYLDAPTFGDHGYSKFFKKPLLAREGANITFFDQGRIMERTKGDYGDEGYVYQAAFDLPGKGNQRPVIGSWIVDGRAAGMGIREDGLITGNTARFIPHVIKD